MSDDLISKKALLERIETAKSESKSIAELIFFDSVMAIVDTQPTAFEKEKVIEELTIRKRIEDEKAAAFDEAGDIQNMEVRDSISLAFQKAIEIVAKGGMTCRN